MSERILPTQPGTVIYVDLPDEHNRVPYILGKNGVWYPVGIGDQPYLDSWRVRAYEWEAV